MTNRWIMHVPVLNTGHLTEDDAGYFESGDSLAHDLGDDGYLIFCGELSDEHPDGTHPNDIEDRPGINACMEWARHNGSNGWLRFAESGDDVDELPRYDW